MSKNLNVSIFNELNEATRIEIKKKVLMESDGVKTIEEAAPINSDLKKGKEERLASLKTQLEQEGNQLADDEKAAIEEEIAKLEGEVYSVDESEEAEDMNKENKQVLTEDSGDVVSRLKSGDDVYFRDENGVAILGHYADNYPEPEEYDEGYKLENGGSEEDLVKAKEASENREVWEFVEINEETLEPNGTSLGYAYGEDELVIWLKDLREVKVIKRLEEKDLGNDTYTDEDEAEYYRNKELYKQSNLARHREAMEKAKKACIEKGIELNEEYSERLGGEPEDFIKDLELIRTTLNNIDTTNFATHLASQIVMEFEETVEDQIKMTKTKYGLEESEVYPVNESEEPKENKIVEAEVKGLKEVKSQGNVYMLQEEKKYIVGENYNPTEGLIENAEVYESKEEADKDYLDRCDVKRDGEKVTESEE